MIPFPYDLTSAVEREGWRERLVMPVDLAAMQENARLFGRTLIQSGPSFSDPHQRMAYEASLPISVRWSLMAAATAAFLDKIGHGNCATRIPEFLFLSGQGPLEPCLAGADRINLFIDKPRRPLARQALITSRWSPWWRLPQALAFPEASAFNSNADLVKGARASGKSIRYENVETTYRKAEAAAEGLKSAPWNAVQLREILARAMSHIPLSPERADRLLSLMTARLTPLFEKTSRLLLALRNEQRLPGEIWTGTGGYWPSRLTGMEIMRRGGVVRRFHHGWNMVGTPYIEGPASIEFLPSTHFVFPSLPAAERWKAEPVADILDRETPVAFESLPPREAKSALALASAAPAGQRPRVLYAAKMLRGYRQWIPAWLPDALTLDWTLRLGEALASLPIDLYCRPHPEGLFGGKRHPLNNISPIPDLNFEQLLPTTDVIVVDGSLSRVFCIALMTDKPVVLVDFGYRHVYASLEPDLAERCAILRARQDDRGLPQVDRDELAAAIFNAKRPPESLVRKFRELYGEA